MPTKQRDRYALVVIAISLVFATAAGLELTFIVRMPPLKAELCAIGVFALFLYFFRPERWQR
jgi:hypothetical protein